jgi:polyhydroxyalkanoate synthase
VDLTKIRLDSYVVAGIADHITRWQNAYRTTQLLGSAPRFALSTTDHIAAMVNPLGNEEASFRTHDGNPAVQPAVCSASVSARTR